MYFWLNALSVIATLFYHTVGIPLSSNTCQSVDVLVLGAGASGIAAARELALQNITNFKILEYNEDIGGRVRHTQFGDKPDSNGSYTVELGANWIHGVGSDNGRENPIWTLAKKHGLKTVDFSESSVATFDEQGPTNFTTTLDEFSAAFGSAMNLTPTSEGDLSYRAGLRLAGWNSEQDPYAQAAEVWGFDFSWAVSPDMASLFYANEDEDDVGDEDGDAYFGPKSNFVLDERGYNYILRQEINSFMSANDSRLHLNTVVRNVSVQDDGVTVMTDDGNCFRAKQAICTFSVGVLQNSALEGGQGPVVFDPPLPPWKQEAIAGFGMGIYTKIFMQFDPDDQFWPRDVENFVYASPTTRAYFPTWQSLSMEGYLPGSGILFATTFTDESHRLERQSDDETEEEALDVLTNMFPAANSTDPPNDFMYPRWGQEPWVYGSYSYWPTGYTVAQHRNLKANHGRLWFAGEHLNQNNQATVHGAWMSGQATGRLLAKCLQLGGKACHPYDSPTQ